MVKSFIILAFAFAGICFADSVTNVSALVGIPLGNAEIAQMPERDGSSPDTVFLGTVKALQTGDLLDLYFHFDANYLTSLTGYADLQDIPAEMLSSFSVTMQDANFSNIVITAYTTFVSNQYVLVNASLQEKFSHRSLTESLKLSLQQNASIWKIVSYDDNDWDN